MPTAQGKQGKWPKKIPVREDREFGNVAKTQGIWFAEVVKVKDIKIFAAKISNLFLKVDKSAKSDLYRMETILCQNNFPNHTKMSAKYFCIQVIMTTSYVMMRSGFPANSRSYQASISKKLCFLSSRWLMG